jgi:hypothetical protein
MEEKFKRNLHNSVLRYQLTCTTFVKVCGVYAPSEKVDERTSRVEELILCSAGIERIVKNLIEDKVPPEQILAQEIAESKRMLLRTAENPDSSFYHHLRAYLIPYTSSVIFPNHVRDLGKTIREAVRLELVFQNEEKLYIEKASDINFDKPTIQKIELEYRKLSRRGL